MVPDEILMFALYPAVSLRPQTLLPLVALAVYWLLMWFFLRRSGGASAAPQRAAPPIESLRRAERG